MVLQGEGKTFGTRMLIIWPGPWTFHQKRWPYNWTHRTPCWCLSSCRIPNLQWYCHQKNTQGSSCWKEWKGVFHVHRVCNQTDFGWSDARSEQLCSRNRDSNHRPKRSSIKHDEMDEGEHSQLQMLAGSLNWTVTRPQPWAHWHQHKIRLINLVRANKAVRSLQGKKAEIYFPDMQDPAHWILLCFMDAALGNLNNGIDSKGGHIVFQANKASGRCSALDWQTRLKEWWNLHQQLKPWVC